jgi:hypothetical protein
VKVVLVNPVEKRYGTVDVEIGDFVLIQEWDGIEVRGVVSLVNQQVIAVHCAQFLGAVHRGDYSEYESKSEFVFNLEDLCYIQVAAFEENTPLSLLRKALNENYCGSESIIMSPKFFGWYKKFMKDESWFHSYCTIPIIVDNSLTGYCVFAIPNEESRKHMITPKRCYALEFFRGGKWLGTHIISCFDDELEMVLANELSRARVPFGAYRLCLDGNVVERGTVKKRFPVRC